VVRGEGHRHPAHELLELAAEQRLLGVVVAAGGRLDLGALVGEDGEGQLGVLLAAHLVEALVAHDAHQPRREGRGRAHVAEPGERLHQGDLGDVLAPDRVAQEAAGEALGGRTDLLGERGERLRVARLGAEDERDVDQVGP
jgi:hypothetical protein